MDSLTKGLVTFFGAPLRGQTYLNMVYLLLAFPLGIFYFIYLVVGLSVGLSLTIIWIGLVILAVVFAGWYGLLAFERAMAIHLLHESIPPMAQPAAANAGFWKKFGSLLSNPVTWKGLVYLIAKFPLGIASFTVLVTFLSAGFAMLLAPAYYTYLPTTYDITFNGLNYYNPWVVDTLAEAIVVSLAGVLVLLVGLQAFNGLAWVSAKFARVMLGNFSRPAVLAGAPGAAMVSAAAAEAVGTTLESGEAPTQAVEAEPVEMADAGEDRTAEDSEMPESK